MAREPIFQSRFNKLNCCVIVPTYNNASTLPSFLEDLKLYTSNIIIINDGSTDETAEILNRYPQFNIKKHTVNQGKGIALKTGFKFAEELNYDYGITIDSDGQHYPDDLYVFLEELEKRPVGSKEILLVGDRNMGSENVPGKSSMGNRFSNFWFLVVTGIELHDSQSGYRLYPVKLINSLKLITWKFELEIEVLVKAAWRDVQVRNIPIKVLYKEEERVTHFRPFWDIVRIVLLYMWFVLVSFFYIHPRNKYQDFRKKGLKKFWQDNIVKSQESPARKAAAICIGVLAGLSPFWGLHTLIVFSLAAVLNLNKVISFLFSNISIPPFIPFIIYAGLQTGSVIMGKGLDWDLNLQKLKSGNDVLLGIWQYLIGSIVFAILVSGLTWIIFYFIFSVIKRKKVVKP
ncbi:DUF2062 domain-containing protein [Christiangramia salexigens]|uniref:Glycosyltransferase n=1 Tax=Christiangramia salexigens TaxID=1913577 RepID=A0A1L3J315_9FLAO|nr:DUF2062 domain-containing protein [Christiangramia salexigens]APG59513.1 glycosyltransferase [Christiangramia salexigens]